MNKIISLLIAVLMIGSLSACDWFGGPISTTRPLPSATAAPDETESPDVTYSPDTDYEGYTNAPEVESAEVAKMVRDAEELINEGLIDDAKMLLRDLRSRDLSEADKKAVDKLQSRLVQISD